MATQAFQRESDPGPVVAPADLVALVGAEQLRRLHVRMAIELKASRRGEKVTFELERGADGVASIHYSPRKRL